MCYMSFLTDFLAGIGVPMMVPQSKEWNVSLVDVSRSLTGNTFTQGIGSLVAVPFARRFGYLPVMFWSTLLTVFFTMVCAVAPTWIGFIAVRILQGFFSTTAQVLGLTIIQEMFFFEEHVGKINIWGWSVLVGPYFGPFISSFILRSLTWRQSFWFFSGLVAVGFLSVIFIMDETAYDRETPGNNPPRPKGYWNPVSWNNIRTSLFYHLYSPQTKLLTHSQCWTVGINGTLITFLVPPVSKGGYGFDTVDISLIYLAPIVAIVAGELFGHFVNEEIQTRIIRTQKGRFIPELRLLALIPSTFLMGVGVSFLGWALGKHWHWLSVAIFWGIFVFAAMCSTVVISAYLLDSFPNDSVAVAALLNFTRVLFGFLVPIFQNPWAQKVGAEWSLSTQGAICVFAYGLVLVVQMRGKEWRVKAEMCPDEITVEWSYDGR
ncbi:MFS general substrate transporter [Wilcoxina mikolae CBS 423.85]|nr:MFS general substrate transporter [Wilcoxina mikolae CBS 423.85]